MYERTGGAGFVADESQCDSGSGDTLQFRGRLNRSFVGGSGFGDDPLLLWPVLTYSLCSVASAADVAPAVSVVQPA